jgi:hypothetical protein
MPELQSGVDGTRRVYTIWAGAKGGKGERETAHPFAIDPGPDPDPDPDPVTRKSEREKGGRE